MTQYLDTSVLVAAFTTEPGTVEVQAWLGRNATSELAISDWVTAEFSAALSIKMRTRQLDAGSRADALALFAAFRAESLLNLPVSALHFRLAAQFADQHALGLRAPDALHLAICADHGATLFTLDRGLANAGLVLGIDTSML